MSSRRRKAAARREQKNQKEAGASPVVPPAFLMVGKLHRAHGVGGEMIMSLVTDFPERLESGTAVYLGPAYEEATIEGIRHHNRGAIVALEGFKSREEVIPLRNLGVFVRTDDRPPLPEGEYYLHQIIGLQAVTEEGEVLGVVADWLETGANGVLIVRTEEGGEILLPDIDEVVLDLNLEEGKMLIHLLEGLV